MSDVIAIIGDNAEVNKALSNLCEKPLFHEKRHNKLDEEELAAEEILRKKVIPTETGFDEPANSVAEFMKRRKLTKAEHDNGHIETRFLLPTSNLVEKFFSVSGLAYDDFRQNMTPMNLEI